MSFHFLVKQKLELQFLFQLLCLVFLIYVLEYISKFVTLIVMCGDNFPNFCPIDVFSMEMDSHV